MIDPVVLFQMNRLKLHFSSDRRRMRGEFTSQLLWTS